MRTLQLVSSHFYEKKFKFNEINQMKILKFKDKIRIIVFLKLYLIYPIK